MNKLIIFVFCSICILGVAFADSKAKTAVAVKTDKAPLIDGKISDGEWKNISWQNSFVACPGDARTNQQTKFAVMFDKENIYIVAKCNEMHIDKVKLYINNDIKIWKHDGLEFFIQRVGGNEKYKQFLVSAGGGKYALEFTPFISNGKREISSKKWQAAVKIDDAGYTIETQIPFSFFGKIKPENGMEWRLNIQRNATTIDSDRYSSWSPVTRFHNPADFGYLLFAFSGSQLLQKRISLKKRFNTLKSQTEKFRDKYAKSDPVFAAKINDELERVAWKTLERQGKMIMNIDKDQLVMINNKLSDLSICIKKLKQARSDYLLEKFFNE